jgi:colanic acid/amylovoran biosynthesis glycosyltransferase
MSARNLRIAYMTGVYPRATDTFIQREVAGLRRQGVHVETFSLRPPAEKEIVGPEQQAERQGTYYVQPPCPLTIFRAHASMLFSSPRRYFSALRTALFVRAPGLKSLVWQVAYFVEAGVVAHRMRRSGLVHLHNHFSNSSCSVAILVAEMAGLTFSFTMHGPSEFFEPHYWRIDEKLRRALFVACISHFCRSQAMVFAPQEKWDKLHVVHCGVNPADFKLATHKGTGSRLLFVGRLANVKGLPILLQAVARLRASYPGVKLTIAGDGPDRQRLLALAGELGILENVAFLGYQTQRQVRELLGQADAFVMASFAEGVPVVLMEAMAAGVPVVATRIAGIPELVEDGVSGFLVPPGDPKALADKVDQLLRDPALRVVFGARGREKVDREFDLAAEADKLCRLMTAALEGQSTQAVPAPAGATAPPQAERPAAVV